MVGGQCLPILGVPAPPRCPPLPGSWTDKPGAATPTDFGAVTQQSRASGQGGEEPLCPQNNVLLLPGSASVARTPNDSVVARAGAEGRAAGASAPPGGLHFQSWRDWEPRTLTPTLCGAPGVPALPQLTARGSPDENRLLPSASPRTRVPQPPVPQSLVCKVGSRCRLCPAGREPRAGACVCMHACVYRCVRTCVCTPVCRDGGVGVGSSPCNPPPSVPSGLLG